MLARRRTALVSCAALVSAAALAGGWVPADAAGKGDGVGLAKIKHIVVIYEENHSFDNLYGLWGSVNGEPVNGLPQADATHTTQMSQAGPAYTCLKQNDLNLKSP